MALAPALRRRPALEILGLMRNPFGEEGLAALVAPPPPPRAGALPPPTGVLTKLMVLDLRLTQVTDAGCAAFASALENGMLPALPRGPHAAWHPCQRRGEIRRVCGKAWPPGEGLYK